MVFMFCLHYKQSVSRWWQISVVALTQETAARFHCVVITDLVLPSRARLLPVSYMVPAQNNNRVALLPRKQSKLSESNPDFEVTWKTKWFSNLVLVHIGSVRVIPCPVYLMKEATADLNALTHVVLLPAGKVVKQLVLCLSQTEMFRSHRSGETTVSSNQRYLWSPGIELYKGPFVTARWVNLVSHRWFTAAQPAGWGIFTRPHWYTYWQSVVLIPRSKFGFKTSLAPWCCCVHSTLPVSLI